MKRLRLNKGVNQSAIAELCGVTIGSVSKWEAGLFIPDGENIEKIAKFLDVEPYEMFYDFIANKGVTKKALSIEEALKTINEYVKKTLREH